jgi:hypothetical protein
MRPWPLHVRSHCPLRIRSLAGFLCIYPEIQEIDQGSDPEKLRCRHQEALRALLVSAPENRSGNPNICIETECIHNCSVRIHIRRYIHLHICTPAISLRS